MTTMPAVPDRPPEYEAIGASRSAAGIYEHTITYATHIRPIAVRLRCGC